MDLLRNRMTNRSLFFVAGDLFLLGLASVFSFLILTVVRGAAPDWMITDIGIYTATSFAGLLFFRTYNIHWRFVSLRDLARIFQGLLTGAAAYGLCSLLLYGPTRYYLAFSVIAFLHSILLIGGFRISQRMYHEVLKKPKRSRGVLIFGAGTAGEQIIRDILRNNDWELRIEGIFDDDEKLWGSTLHDIRILGGRERLYQYLKLKPVKEVIIAAPSMRKKSLKEIIDEMKSINPRQRVRVLPSFQKLADQPVTVKNIRDIRLEDILGREPAEINYSRIQSDIRGKRILVTGAGGSIGSEMVRQLLKFGPEQLIAMDVDETELFQIENELNDPTVLPFVADITDAGKMEILFKNHQPDIVFHAAAYKHVPMMEQYPEEAVRVNIGGTRLISEISCRYGVKKFILVSTDKAVNPTNVMGATKRVAEQICMSCNSLRQNGHPQNGHSQTMQCQTRFMSVRFGNVLGSRGSVVPLFIEQINDGGPVTITDPNMTRYFMTIPEAVLLVIQAGTMGEGGEVFVLDMGEPVKILDMARQLIRLHGLEPERDIPIVYSGLRPGEKLYEELLNSEEGVLDTDHAQIYKANCCSWHQREVLEFRLERLLKSGSLHETERIRSLLKELVPSYTYNGELNGNGKLKANGETNGDLQPGANGELKSLNGELRQIRPVIEMK